MLVALPAALPAQWRRSCVRTSRHAIQRRACTEVRLACTAALKQPGVGNDQVREAAHGCHATQRLRLLGATWQCPGSRLIWREHCTAPHCAARSMSAAANAIP